MTNRPSPRTTSRVPLLLLALAATTACASVNSTPDAPQILPQERQQAAAQNPQILAEFGGEYQSPASAYVTRIGDKTAIAAGVPGQCNFTVINTDVINAFAVPGCYIYITRGLLAVMNSEDELASVLGHEIGHVVADHSDRRQNSQTLAGLGAVLVGVLSGSGELANAAGQAAQAYTLGYSRDQEYESDDLGERYMIANGYNPFAAAQMLGALGAASSLDALTRGQETQQIPEWSSTHPLSENRVQRALANARASGIDPQSIPLTDGPFLAATNNMIYGDDPEQGLINGTTFSHPSLKLSFEAPAGFSLQNSPQAVLISGPNNQRAMFAGGALGDKTLSQYTQAVLQAFLGETQAQIGQLQTSNIHGFETARLPARVQNSQGQLVDVAVTAYRFKADSAFHFITLAPANGGQDLAALLSSFRALTDAEAAALKPRVIQVVTVGRNDTIATLSRRMAFDTYQEERFRVLNGLDANAQLAAGQQVKIVVFGQ